MKKINLFCFGFGQVAKHLTNKLVEKNLISSLNVTTRQPTNEFRIKNLVCKNFELNELSYDKNLLKALNQSDHLLVSVPPINGKDIVIKYFLKKIKISKFDWVTYLSATSVYGNHDGKWVDEKTVCNPTSENGKARLNAENKWLNLFEFGVPLQIFRLSGIYSQNNNVLYRLMNNNSYIVDKKNHFFSRIHLEDISNIIIKSFLKFKPGEIYNISDDKPASSKDVTLYGAKILSKEVPKKVQVNELQSEMLKNFYKDSKKIKNDKAKKFFEYEMKFPSYIEGLNYIKNNII